MVLEWGEGKRHGVRGWEGGGSPGPLSWAFRSRWLCLFPPGTALSGKGRRAVRN